jgi:hypothetical protein
MAIAGIPHSRAVRALGRAGFRVVRQSKHIIMSDGKRIVTIPRRWHQNDIDNLDRGIKNLQNWIRGNCK